LPSQHDEPYVGGRARTRCGPDRTAVTRMYRSCRHVIVLRGCGDEATVMLWTVIVGASCGACGGWLCRWALRRTRPALRLPSGSCELGTAVVCALVVGWLVSRGASATELPVPLVVATLVVPLTLTDLIHRRLPDVLTLPAYVLLALALTLTVATGA